MITADDIQTLYEILQTSSERYPITILHVFKGTVAWNLHKEMVSLKEDWLNRVSEAEKESSRMIVSLQRTVSKATLQNPSKRPSNPRQTIFIRFDIPGSEPIVSHIGYTSPKGNQWLKLIHTNQQYDLYR